MRGVSILAKCRKSKRSLVDEQLLKKIQPVIVGVIISKMKIKKNCKVQNTDIW